MVNILHKFLIQSFCIKNAVKIILRIFSFCFVCILLAKNNSLTYAVLVFSFKIPADNVLF